MYAIIEVGGFQYKVTKDQKLNVPKIEQEVGKKVDFKDVLLVVDKDKVDIGKPVIKNAAVTATVISHGRYKKINVFKKKRRKGYKVLKGHRQDYTKIQIDSIGAAKPAAKKPADKESAPKAAEAKPAAKTAAKKPAAKAPAKKSAPKKPAAKPKTGTAAKAAPKTAKPAAKTTAKKTAAKKKAAAKPAAAKKQDDTK